MNYYNSANKTTWQEEIAFNLQVTANQQQATEKERERNEAEQAELRRRQAEWN